MITLDLKLNLPWMCLKLMALTPSPVAVCLGIRRNDGPNNSGRQTSGNKGTIVCGTGRTPVYVRIKNQYNIDIARCIFFFKKIYLIIY